MSSITQSNSRPTRAAATDTSRWIVVVGLAIGVALGIGGSIVNRQPTYTIAEHLSSVGLITDGVRGTEPAWT